MVVPPLFLETPTYCPCIRCGLFLQVGMCWKCWAPSSSQSSDNRVMGKNWLQVNILFPYFSCFGLKHDSCFGGQLILSPCDHQLLAQDVHSEWFYTTSPVVICFSPLSSPVVNHLFISYHFLLKLRHFEIQTKIAPVAPSSVGHQVSPTFLGVQCLRKALAPGVFEDSHERAGCHLAKRTQRWTVETVEVQFR